MYVGYFNHDQKHGKGQLYFPDGQVNAEEWINGHQKSTKRITNPQSQSGEPNAQDAQ